MITGQVLPYILLVSCGRTGLSGDAPPTLTAATGGTPTMGAITTAQSYEVSTVPVVIGGGFFATGGSFPVHAGGGAGSNLEKGGQGALGSTYAFGGGSGAAVSSGGNTGGAVSSGESISTGDAPCDVIVSPPIAIQSAIDASPSPGLVCVRPGLYKEDLKLRDGVSLRGTGTDAMICGSVNADAADSLGAKLSQLSILHSITAVGSVRLELLDLDVQQPPPVGCPYYIDDSVNIKRANGRGIRLSATRVHLTAWGFVLSLDGSDVATDDQILITQSSCTDPNQCWGFLNLTVGTPSSGIFQPGSRVSVELSNNLVPNVVLDGIIVASNVPLRPEDAAQSRILIRHNSLISRGDSNNGVTFYGVPSMPVVFANNVISYISHPIHNDNQIPLRQSGNLLSSDKTSASWFENFDAGNFIPSANSPLIGAADSEYAVPVDIDGRPRQGHYDIGAYQR